MKDLLRTMAHIVEEMTDDARKLAIEEYEAYEKTTIMPANAVFRSYLEIYRTSLPIGLQNYASFGRASNLFAMELYRHYARIAFNGEE